MNSLTSIPSTARPEAVYLLTVAAGDAVTSHAANTHRVLRNTYALLSMTLRAW